MTQQRNDGKISSPGGHSRVAAALLIGLGVLPPPGRGAPYNRCDVGGAVQE